MRLSERSQPQPLNCGMPQGLVFTWFTKLLGEVIPSNGVSRYADVTELYISVPAQVSNVANVLCWCLKATEDGMAHNTQDWVALGPPESRNLSALILDGITLSQTDPVNNLGVLLDSWLLLKEQVVVIVRRAITQLQFVHQLCSFLDEEALRSTTYAVPIFFIVYCNVLYMRLPLNNIQTLQLINTGNMESYVHT